MTTLYKFIVGILSVAVVSLLIFIGYQQYKMTKRINEIQSSVITQKQLDDSITRSSSEFVSKDNLEKMIQQNGVDLKAIQKDISSLNAQLTGMNNLVIVSQPQNTKDLPSTTTTKTDTTNDAPIDPANPDPFGYQKSTQHLALAENFSNGTKAPFADVAFSANRAAPWGITAPARQYKITSVYGHGSDGKAITYSKATVVIDGKSYDLPIDQSSTTSIAQESSFSWFNPKLQFQANGGIQMDAGKPKAEFVPSIGLTLSSYGKTKTQPDFQFFGVAGGYGVVSKSPSFVFTPIQANVSKYLPFTTNVMAGPYVNVNVHGDFGAGFGISVNF